MHHNVCSRGVPFSLKSKQCSRSLKTKFKIPRCVRTCGAFLCSQWNAPRILQSEATRFVCVCVWRDDFWFSWILQQRTRHPLKIGLIMNFIARAYQSHVAHHRARSSTTYRSFWIRARFAEAALENCVGVYTLQMQSTTHRSAHTRKKCSIILCVYCVFFFYW